MTARNVIGTGAALLLGLGTAPLAAQDRPAHWPDASALVQQALRGESSVALATALVRCQEENPYRDSVRIALLDAPLTDQLVTQLGIAFSPALFRCDDPRLERWYQQRLLDGYTGGAIFLPLIGHRTPGNVEVLKQVAFDPSRDEVFRNLLLEQFSYALSWQERADLYLDGYASRSPIPHPYAYNAYWALMGSPVADQFLPRLLQAVEEDPHNPNAVRVLGFVAHDSRVWRRGARPTASWRGLVRSTLVRIERNRDGRFPEELVAAARAHLERMDASP